MINIVFNYTQACTQNLKCISLLVSEKIATHVKHHKNGNTKLEALYMLAVPHPINGSKGFGERSVVC